VKGGGGPKDKFAPIFQPGHNLRRCPACQNRAVKTFQRKRGELERAGRGRNTTARRGARLRLPKQIKPQSAGDDQAAGFGSPAEA